MSPDQGNDSPVSQSGGQSPIFNSNDDDDEDDDNDKKYDFHQKTVDTLNKKYDIDEDYDDDGFGDDDHGVQHLIITLV